MSSLTEMMMMNECNLTQRTAEYHELFYPGNLFFDLALIGDRGRTRLLDIVAIPGVGSYGRTVEQAPKGKTLPGTPLY